jgi:predicted phosphate transport protein (TIGR00153 family)
MNFTKLFQVLVPKDKKFFPLFEQDAENLVKAAVLLNKLFLVNDTSEAEQIIKKIKEHEKIGDDFTHKIFDELNKTFITPFDREDIYMLNSSLDDVLDYINSCAKKIQLYKPKSMLPHYLELSELILQGAREIRVGLSELKNIKNPQKIKQSCVRINEIENQADDIYHQAITDLYENEKDAIELIKKMDILAALEEATDKEEDISDVIKSIIIKMA